MTTILRVREPREILALVPYQLGFVPQRSAVLVSLRGERQRVGLIARADVADLESVEAAPLARSLVEHVRRDRGRAVLVVVYLDGDLTASRGTLERVASTITRAAGPGGVRVAGVWLVTRGRFYVCAWDEVERRVTAWDLPGHPLEELEATEVGATMVMRGVVVADSREQLVQVGPVAAARRRAAVSGARRWWRRRGEGDLDLARWRAEASDAWESLLDEALADPEQAAERLRSTTSAAAVGRLAVSLRDTGVRDTVLAGLVERATAPEERPGPGAATVQQAGRHAAGARGRTEQERVDRAMACVLQAEHGRSPDPDVLSALVGVVEVVAAHGSRRDVAEAYAVLAVLAWWEGSGARARLLGAAALQRVPGHRLALLVEQVLDAGLPPGWVARDAA